MHFLNSFSRKTTFRIVNTFILIILLIFPANMIKTKADQPEIYVNPDGNIESSITGALSEETKDRQESDKTNDDTLMTAGANEIDLGINAKAAVLMEASTGTIIYEKNKDEKLSPASITKIMTLILIFDALESGKLTLEEQVKTSAYAASMGGSQVFLEEGENQTVDTMIKCISVASANDACVCMAEKIAGSEIEFVKMMNEKAQELGMNNTHFEDCCGLSDSDQHYTSAYDVALMSRALICTYPKVHQYSTIWMEDIIHNTARGESVFGLSNTNKLLRQYEYCTGLKTGSTQKAKYCLSATACKDNIELIAVVMAAENYKIRFPEAKTMLEYGYSVCELYNDEKPPVLEPILVKDGKTEYVEGTYEKTFSYLSTTGEDLSEESMIKEIKINEDLTAPIKAGDVIGSLHYSIGDQELGSIDILAGESVEMAGYFDYLYRAWQTFLL